MNINDLFEMGPIGSKLELSATVLAFPPFQRVLLGKKDRSTAIKEIEYILWNNHWKSPFNVIPPEKREQTVKKEIFGDPLFMLSKEALVAEAEYLNCYQTSEILENLKSARIGIWYVNAQFRSLYENEYLTGELKMDGEKVLKMVERLSSAQRSIDSLEKAAKLNSNLDAKVRGGSDIGYYEMPNNNFTKHTTR